MPTMCPTRGLKCRMLGWLHMASNKSHVMRANAQ